MQHQCVSLSAKKNKKQQSTEVMKFNSRQLIQHLKIAIAALKVAWINSETDGAPWSSPCSHTMSTLDFWFESKSNLSSKICFTFTSVLRTCGHLWVRHPHGYYFFGFDFLQTRSYRLYPLIIFEYLMFILNLSHVVRIFVTFVINLS